MKDDAAAVLGTASNSVTLSNGVVVDFRPPKLKELVEIEKKIGKAVYQSFDLVETQMLLIARTGSVGGVPLSQTVVEESWLIEDVLACMPVLLPLLQRSTPGGSPS
jgi:hypothetical protein